MLPSLFVQVGCGQNVLGPEARFQRSGCPWAAKCVPRDLPAKLGVQWPLGAGRAEWCRTLDVPRSSGLIGGRQGIALAAGSREANRNWLINSSWVSLSLLGCSTLSSPASFSDQTRQTALRLIVVIGSPAVRSDFWSLARPSSYGKEAV